MKIKTGRDVVERYPGNPLISVHDLPFRAGAIWNAGVTRFDGKVILLLTIETLEGRFCVHRAESTDGLNFTVDADPIVRPVEEGRNLMYESAGNRDPRITEMDGKFYVVYNADGDHGVRVGLAVADCFNCASTGRRLGYLTQVDVKNGALFPRKINGRYVLAKRPNPGESIWVSRSDDLEFWGDEEVVMTPRGGYWDTHRIGSAAPPMETDAGWLLMYYGEKLTSAGPLVRLGAALLDKDNPARVIARSNIPILSPRERYERIGDTPNVIFSCGALLEDGEVRIYYGASDGSICMGTAPLEDIINVCMEGQRETSMNNAEEMIEKLAQAEGSNEQ